MAGGKFFPKTKLIFVKKALSSQETNKTFIQNFSKIFDNTGNKLIGL